MSILKMKYEHKLKAKQINKKNYKPKDFLKDLSIGERVSLNIAIKNNEDIPIVKAHKAIKQYNIEKKELGNKFLIEISQEEYDKACKELFDKFFVIDDTKFINVITVR